MYIPKKIKREIEEFCIINDIDNVDKFILESINKGFNIEKYGNAPFIQEVIVEKEVPVEIIKEIIVEKEVPVEVIKVVTKEIPVEKEVIKEVLVEKEVYVSDDEKINELGNKNNKLIETISSNNKKINDLQFNVDKKEEEYNIKIGEVLDKENVIKKKDILLTQKNKEIQELKNKILILERENTQLKNKSSVHPEGRPIRDIYDDDVNKGGHWGSNLSDKK
jgi:hypothetical protein